MEWITLSEDEKNRIAWDIDNVIKIDADIFPPTFGEQIVEAILSPTCEVFTRRRFSSFTVDTHKSFSVSSTMSRMRIPVDCEDKVWEVLLRHDLVGDVAREKRKKAKKAEAIWSAISALTLFDGDAEFAEIFCRGLVDKLDDIHPDADLVVYRSEAKSYARWKSVKEDRIVDYMKNLMPILIWISA